LLALDRTRFGRVKQYFMAIHNIAHYLPAFKYCDRDSQSWTTTGNTHTVTNAHVDANSQIVIMNTSVKAGNWYVTVSQGSFTITSSDVETATTTTFNYIIL
jgi:hypothetical protein